MDKAYRTVRASVQHEIVIQKSRFIGRCFPLKQEKDALEQLAAIRKAHWDASHHCYAYVIGRQGLTARYSDDGEPGGTAGLPMMEVLKAKQLTDVLVVVTRYFGGTLLGAGGLVRAYSRATTEVLNEAGTVDMLPSDSFWLRMDYSLWSRLQAPLQKAGYLLEEPEYGQEVRVLLWVQQTKRDTMQKNVIQWSEGRVTPQFFSTEYMAWNSSEL